ncbi:MAG: hypothetical protein B7Z66_00190 [Chromatiales bacterium 21-64-14]|nr:MAG: hypothetical protein B7Z66_00190 [Chromatiales bacterium 21-64-14]HQU16278.1 DUF302 domain-containing protein [Gammaproteobacteria bacterium]
MRHWLLSIFALVLFIPAAHAADNGLVTIKSAHSVPVTINRLEAMLRKKGMTIFARVDHQRGAKKVKLSLRPTTLLIFGNPRLGTPLMQCKQTVGIDLPQKILAWEDAKGQVWLTYNDPQYLAERHGLGTCGAAVVRKMSMALHHFAEAAAGH